MQLVYALGVRVDKGAARLAVAGEALQQRLELRAGAVRRALFRLERGLTAFQLRLILQCHIQLIAHGGERGLCPLKLIGAFLFPLDELCPLPSQLFQLVRAREYAAAARGAAAGHRAAGIDELSVERDDAQGVAALLCHTHGVRQRLRHDGAPEEVCKNALIFIVKARQIKGDADKAGVALGRVGDDRAAYCVERQKRCASRVRALEQLNGAASVVLRVDDDVLRRAAECGLYREGALRIRAHKVCNRTVHAAQIAARRLAHDGLDRLGIALEVLFHLREHRDARIHAARVDLQLGGALRHGGKRVLAAFKLHAAAVEHIGVGLLLLREGG